AHCSVCPLNALDLSSISCVELGFVTSVCFRAYQASRPASTGRIMPNKVAASATTSSPDTVRDLERMVQELQATLDKSVANARAIADEVHREADDWYEKNISRIPE
ncbi:hypothetical protein V5799_023543, partial [Amblyomma americanum]